MGILNWLYEGLTNLIGLVVPVFGRARESKAVSAVARWTVRVLLLGGILVGLYFLNNVLGFDKLLASHPSLQRYWLPVIFVLMYALLWLGWVLYKLLTAEEEHPEFPDIHDAWEAA